MMHAAIFYVIILYRVFSNSLEVFSLSSEKELRLKSVDIRKQARIQ